MVAKFLDLNKPWSCKYDRKKNEKKNDMYDFPVHNCTQEQDGSPYLSFIVRQQMTVSVKKSCYYGNLMSQVSPQ